MIAVSGPTAARHVRDAICEVGEVEPDARENRRAWASNATTAMPRRPRSTNAPSCEPRLPSRATRRRSVQRPQRPRGDRAHGPVQRGARSLTSTMSSRAEARIARSRVGRAWRRGVVNSRSAKLVPRSSGPRKRSAARLGQPHGIRDRTDRSNFWTPDEASMGPPGWRYDFGEPRLGLRARGERSAVSNEARVCRRLGGRKEAHERVAATWCRHLECELIRIEICAE